MSESRKVLFIINRYSGTGYRESLEGKIVSACEQRGLECSIEFTRKPGHGTTLAKMAVKKNYAAVFAVGGDGTVNEVAQGLLHSTVPLGIIPKGSGNGLARHLHIPLQIDKALHLLELKRVIPIDTFTINGRLSLNVSGIGFDGFVAGQFGKDGKRGLAGYGKLVVTHFKRFNEFSSILKTENDSIQRKAFIISIANSSQFGNNAIIAPHASVCDSELDVCIVKKMNVWEGLSFVNKLFTHSLHRSRLMTQLKTKSVSITTENPIPYHIDGEAVGSASQFDININPASLLVSIPEGQHKI